MISIPKKLLFGSKYNRLPRKKKIVENERTIIALIISNILLIFCISLLLYISFGYLFFNTEKKTEIYYDNLTDNEILLVKEILSELNPLYLIGHKKIIFTKDLENSLDKHAFFLKRLRDKDELKSADGFNQNKEIYVKYTADIEFLKDTLCHEIMHTYTKKGETTHKIVYNLGSNLVCFINN